MALWLLYSLVFTGFGKNRFVKEIDLGILARKEEVVKAEEDNIQNVVSAVSVSKPADEIPMDISYDKMTPIELEKQYGLDMAEFKEKQKQLKTMQLFFVELSKAYSNYSKELTRLSLVAHANIKNTVDDATAGSGGTSSTNNPGSSADPEQALNSHSGYNYFDIWWNSLSISLDHSSQDHELIAHKLTNDVCIELGRLNEEMIFIEKKLAEDSAKYILQLREGSAVYDARIKDKLKYQERLDKYLVVNNLAGTGTGGGATNTAAGAATAAAAVHPYSNEYVRLQSKVTVADAAVADSSSVLNSASSQFTLFMPR